MWKNKWLLRIVSIISPLFSLLGVTLFNVSSATYLIILLIWAVIALINMVKLYQINGEIKNNSNKMFLKISQLKDKNDSSDDIGCLEERCLKRVEREKKLYKKRKNTLTDLISIFCIIRVLLRRTRTSLPVMREAILEVYLKFSQVLGGSLSQMMSHLPCRRDLIPELSG